MEDTRFEGEDNMRRTILVSDLGLFTGGNVRKYLSQFGLVEELAFIHALAHGIMYTRSCKVKMASVFLAC
nr:hypothetical protein [Tanacetum cinerariifolium]